MAAEAKRAVDRAGDVCCAEAASPAEKDYAVRVASDTTIPIESDIWTNAALCGVGG